MDELTTILSEATATRAFPGCVVWLAKRDDVLVHQASGNTAYEVDGSTPVSCETVYDIASLTKLFTTAAALIACRSEAISLDTTISHFFSEFHNRGVERITLRQLMQHSSGIEIAVQDLLHVPVDAWPRCIAEAPLLAAPGSRVLYSCTNYFLLGRIVEKLCGQPLDIFVAQQLLKPLGMQRTDYRPLRKLALRDIAPAECKSGAICELSDAWHGVVHDEAARAVESAGGTSGNAGLFSTAADLGRFALMWLQRGAFDGRQIIAGADVEQSFSAIFDDGTARRGLGWQIDAAFYMTPSAPGGSAGHAGFTGPTFWLHPQTGHTAIILNNRVFPTRSGPDRMPFHRRISEWLLQHAPYE